MSTGRAGKPARPRPSSTVILLREHQETLQVYLMKRSASSGFYPGGYVFPGGVITTEDDNAAFWRSHADLTPDEIMNRFGMGRCEEEILPYAVAAIRETFEEAGVFLGIMGQGDETLFERTVELRSSEGLRENWLREWVTKSACILGFSMLRPWAHWITPEAIPRRFDTRFFIASMPPFQTCKPDRKETVGGTWLRPEEALAQNLKGETCLPPPTLVTMHQMLSYTNIGALHAALKTRSWGKPLLPRMIPLSRGSLILEPWDPMYDQEFNLDGSHLESAVLPVGAPFSRIWMHDGVCKPIMIM